MLSTVSRHFCRTSALNLFKPTKGLVTNGSCSAQSFSSKVSYLWSRGNTFRSFQVLIIRNTTTAAPKEVKLFSAPKNSERVFGWWLFGCTGLVFGSIILGGVSRLLQSGFSVSSCKLFSMMPPRSEREWLLEFRHFLEFPDCKLKESNMTLNEFKFIWYMEFVQRKWGLLLGAVYFAPAAYLWVRDRIPSGVKARVPVFAILIALQDQLDWNTLRSGFENRFAGQSDSKVSQYFLASQLGVSLLLFSVMLSTSLQSLLPAQNLSASALADSAVIKKARFFLEISQACKRLIFFTIFTGALVSGLEAGHIYNTFPKMGEKWVPDDVWALSPKYKNFFENPSAVQVNHRFFGGATFALICVMWLLSRRTKLPPRAYTAASAVAAMAWLQVILGVTSLVNHVPVPAAASHQSGSLLLVSTAVWLSHELKYLKHLPK